jgi:hypothetical protein
MSKITRTNARQGIRREMHNAVLTDWIKARSQEAELVLSVCTGALFLAKAGQLDGRRVRLRVDLESEPGEADNGAVAYDCASIDAVNRTVWLVQGQKVQDAMVVKGCSGYCGARRGTASLGSGSTGLRKRYDARASEQPGLGQAGHSDTERTPQRGVYIARREHPPIRDYQPSSQRRGFTLVVTSATCCSACYLKCPLSRPFFLHFSLLAAKRLRQPVPRSRNSVLGPEKS